MNDNSYPIKLRGHLKSFSQSTDKPIRLVIEVDTVRGAKEGLLLNLTQSSSDLYIEMNLFADREQDFYEPPELTPIELLAQAVGNNGDGDVRVELTLNTPGAPSSTLVVESID